MTDTYLAAVASKERAKGLAHVRDINNEWRREVGMPRRVPDAMQLALQIKANFGDFQVAMERAAESIRAVERFAIPFRHTTGVRNPGAPDGRNPWEDEPAPIWDAVVAKHGRPPL